MNEQQPHEDERNQQHEPEQHEQPEQQEQEPDFRPEIYVASLADYNNGRLHGVWLDAAQEPEQLHDQIVEMLKRSEEPGAEEWAIHDYQDFCRVRLGEYESIEMVSKIAKGLQEHGQAFGAWAEHLGSSAWDELDSFTDRYMGHFESLTAYGEEFLEALGLTDIIEKAVPAELQAYVKLDAEGFARNLQLSGDIHTVEDGFGGVFVFGG